MAASQTLEYYDKHAAQFAADTANVDFSQTQERFLQLLPQSAHILDFGCGAGRDARYFLERGFAVDAVDGSAELCRLASERVGIPVRQMLFCELDALEAYDGIWACSSILHLAHDELVDVLGRIARALKPRGVLYTSFKYGTFEGMRNGRYFIDLTYQAFCDLAAAVPMLRPLDHWISGDVRPGRGDERWLNLLLRRA